MCPMLVLRPVSFGLTTILSLRDRLSQAILFDPPRARPPVETWRRSGADDPVEWVPTERERRVGARALCVAVALLPPSSPPRPYDRLWHGSVANPLRAPSSLPSSDTCPNNLRVDRFPTNSYPTPSSALGFRLFLASRLDDTLPPGPPLPPAKPVANGDRQERDH